MFRKPFFAIVFAMLAMVAVSCRKDVNTVEPGDPDDPEVPVEPENPVEPGDGDSGGGR